MLLWLVSWPLMWSVLVGIARGLSGTERSTAIEWSVKSVRGRWLTGLFQSFIFLLISLAYLFFQLLRVGFLNLPTMTVEFFVAPFFFYYKILLHVILKQCYQVFTHLPIHKD